MGGKNFLKAVLLAAALVLFPSNLHADNDHWLDLMEPVLRVKITGGSATLVHESEKGIFILTNYHVAKGFVRMVYKAEQPSLGDNIFFTYFSYLNGRVVGTDTLNAVIVLISEQHDLVLLKVSPQHEGLVRGVAKLATMREYDELEPLDSVYVVGCPGTSTPVPTEGSIMKLGLKAKNMTFDLLINAQVANGNSGGAVYRKGTRSYLGVPSAVAYFNGHPVNHLSFVVSVKQIYPWLMENGYDFIVPRG